MKKTIILKPLFFVVCLIISLLLFEKIMNRGNTDMTAEMSPASFPIVYMNMSGEMVNALHGYSTSMDVAHMRDTITPFGTNRKLGFIVKKYGVPISGVAYEVRSTDGTRLIEDTIIEDYTETDDSILAFFTMKDLMEQGREYNLVVKLTLGTGQKVYYYTKLLQVEDYSVAEKINFIKFFHEATFQKEIAGDLISQYLESNSEGDNSTLQKVDIHSSLDQVTWASLHPVKESDVVIDIKEMMLQTASFQVHYKISSSITGRKQFYNVTEYYRIRYTNERVYLLDFERRMEQVFDETGSTFGNTSIYLGIHDSEKIQMMECDGGNIFAFQANNRLFTYNTSDNKLSRLFAFYDEDNNDARCDYAMHGIKILNVNETGDVKFLAYGYMNRGRHEGQCGVQLNYYSNSQNMIEEVLFIPYDRSPEILKKDIEKLSYIGKNDKLYLMIDAAVYEISLSNLKVSKVADHLEEERYVISETGKGFAWVEDTYRSDRMTIMNMATGQKATIVAESGNYIRPMGFMGEHIIYGLADRDDLIVDVAGQVSFPIHTIKIQDLNGKVLKEYNSDPYNVLNWEIDSNQIVLHRVEKNSETMELTPVEDDQIMNSREEEEGKNKLETVVIETEETVNQISLKNEIDAKTLQILTPRELLFEGENAVSIAREEEGVQQFYLYTTKGLSDTYTSPAKAVEEAYETAGVVINDLGNTVWYRGNRAVKNQIMKITGTQVTENSSQLSVCLDTMLAFENVNRSTQYMLERGKSAVDILSDNIPNIQVLDLHGCSLDAILYYTNLDIPVLVTLQDSSARLIIGFNELNIVVMDPELGTVYKVGKNDATNWLSENGNCFITYVKTE